MSTNALPLFAAECGIADLPSLVVAIDQAETVAWDLAAEEWDYQADLYNECRAEGSTYNPAWGTTARRLNDRADFLLDARDGLAETVFLQSRSLYCGV